jgi:hypothetical protein
MTKTKTPTGAAAKPSHKPDVTSTGRDRAIQHIDAKRLGKY